MILLQPQMKRKLLYTVLLACLISIPSNAQVNLACYKAMYDIVRDSLHIDKAYVSDSLREHSILGIYLYEINLRDTIPFYCPTKESEYSLALHSCFNSIEENVESMSPCSNIIYFSFSDESYVSAYAFLCVKPLERKDAFPYPNWGYYKKRYSFIFQLREDDVVLKEFTEVHGL